MKLKLLPLLILALTSLCQGVAQAIVGGQDVPVQDALTRQVLHIKNTSAIYNPETRKPMISVSHCTGSAISSRVVLTAAHCSVADRIASVNYARADGSEVSIAVDYVILHPDFSDTNDKDDIALMVLESDLPADFEILNLPEKCQFFTTVTAAGFGKNDGRILSGGGWGKLRSTELSLYQYSNTEKLFSVSQIDGHGACDGDSGSPAIVNQDKKNYVVGIFENASAIHSEDPDRDTCSFIGYYVNVQPHLEWIHENLKKISGQ
jgi:secreted trypsin-like serine protease